MVEQSPRQADAQASAASIANDAPQPLGPSRWNWGEVKRVLLIRLRSIGDTVLSTASIHALSRFLPDAEIDILVENWVAPVLDEHPFINNVITFERGGLSARARVAHEIRSRHYDVVYNLHGGTTATFLTRATGARHRVGYASYQYAQLHNHQAPSPLLLWGQQRTHSVEQQLALLGWTGIPVTDRPPTKLAVTRSAEARINEILNAAGLTDKEFALIHPAAAFATKQWAANNFAKVADYLAANGIATIAIAGPNQAAVLNELITGAATPIVACEVSLPEVTALASRSHLFVGNDSGIAHIAAAVGTPSVVVFGSSNIAHWRPWTSGPAEVVFEEMPCQPCHGYFCEKFPEPECILRVPVERVTSAIERLLAP
ncbi:MAG TPA: glycosyltransferase family 9 protein [Pyrinomonadaceae bacterium]|nr:glycosyltransferase family 9 protein [Pyrinomonadaceae bacterium]